MNRKDTTKFLSHLLEVTKFSGYGKYWAKEVTLDYGKTEIVEDKNGNFNEKSKTKRIDYLQFEPINQLSIDGIEKGIFICYEIKSCKEDFLSGYGQNFIGEKNYLVMTMQTYKELVECGEINKLSHKIGILVAMPLSRKYSDRRLIEEYENPTKLEDCADWYLETIRASNKSYREKSMIELLFCMLRSNMRGLK